MIPVPVYLTISLALALAQMPILPPRMRQVDRIGPACTSRTDYKGVYKGLIRVDNGVLGVVIGGGDKGVYKVIM